MNYNRKKTDLVVVTKEPFPMGMGATNRILSYLCEIAKKKSVTVLIAVPTELPDMINNTLAAGVFKNINFKYIHKKTIWPKKSSKLFKAYLIFLSFPLLFINLRKENPKTVLLGSNDVKLIILTWFFSKILRFNYFQEKSEKPPVLKKKTSVLYKIFYLSLYKYFDGIIVMTKELTDLFNSLGQGNTFHLPMTVDLERFSHIEKHDRDINKTVFIYCGGGNIERDGLLSMVEAFIDVRKTNKNFEFQIIGPIIIGSPYSKRVIELIDSKETTIYIKSLGKKNTDEIPNLLGKSDCLIMTPQKDFDSGGFPTKLGEFLATGKPVICSKVSEIPYYLDNNSAILVEPQNHEELTKTILSVIKDYQSFIRIGENGKKVAMNCFFAGRYTDSLIQFLKIE
jgi:glycosyltransferase involved in cell wall biosynthesis